MLQKWQICSKKKSHRSILKVTDNLFTFLSNPLVPYGNNASEQGVRKIKIKQEASGCFRTDGGSDDFAKLQSLDRLHVQRDMRLGAKLLLQLMLDGRCPLVNHV